MEELNEDKYISYNEYKKFCENNNIDINEKWLGEKTKNLYNKN